MGHVFLMNLIMPGLVERRGKGKLYMDDDAAKNKAAAMDSDMGIAVESGSFAASHQESKRPGE